MVLGLFCVPLEAAHATMNKGPVTVEANQMEILEGGKQAIFTGLWMPCAKMAISRLTR